MLSGLGNQHSRVLDGAAGQQRAGSCVAAVANPCLNSFSGAPPNDTVANSGHSLLLIFFSPDIVRVRIFSQLGPFNSVLRLRSLLNYITKQSHEYRHYLCPRTTHCRDHD